MKRHLFCSINYLFRPQNPLDAAREEPIFLKKLTKGDANWSTKKVVLGWAIDTAKQIIALPSTNRDRIEDATAGIQNQAERVSKNKWYRLLGNFFSTVPSIAEAEGMFSRM